MITMNRHMHENIVGFMGIRSNFDGKLCSNFDSWIGIWSSQHCHENLPYYKKEDNQRHSIKYHLWCEVFE